MGNLFGTSEPRSVRIAVNVMRARLTVVGFNIAIVTFQLIEIHRIGGGIRLPDVQIPLHLEAGVALLIGLGLSILAMIFFIASSAIDHEGVCTHWSLLAGDLFMYLGLAHSVSGFFGPFARMLDQVALDAPQEMASLTAIRAAIVIVGGAAWLFAAYVGPAVSLIRSPFGRRITVALGVAYLLVLISLAHVSAHAVRLEMARDANSTKPPPSLFNELIQPLRW